MTVFAILCDNVLPKDTNPCKNLKEHTKSECRVKGAYESFATVGEIRVWWRADFQRGSRVLKKVI